jgi:membrane protease YdiL (CAAX protease family)
MQPEPAVTPQENPPQGPTGFGLFLRAGFFLLMIWLGIRVFATFFNWIFDANNYVSPINAIISVFAASAIASTIVVRIYERGMLADIGMNWGPASLRQLWTGILAGGGVAIVIIASALLFGAASFSLSSVPGSAFSMGRLILTATLLLFGAVGEEMMFRGYSFQLLAGAFGPWPVIPSFAILFALAHLGNPDATWLGVANTGLWGLVLGFAMWRSGALWLPIGLHYGWNVVFPLAGAPLSGLKMGLSGYELRWHAADWLSGGNYGPEGSVLTTLACALLLVWLWRGKIERQHCLLLDVRRDDVREEKAG